MKKLDPHSHGTEIRGTVDDKIDTKQENHSNIINEKSKIEEDLRFLSSKNSKILENIELKEIIGYGNDTKIYRGIWNKSKAISIKLIMNKKRKKKNNNNEIKISNKLKNKNIINHYGTIIEDNEDFIIMEDGKFGNLKNFKNKELKKLYLSESLLCFFIYQILNGLKYIHLCKIAHFDLKPQNIIINQYLDVKIIDFSVSLDYSKIQSKKIQLPFRGTVFFMAPEVIKGETIDLNDINKIDLYSVGVMLYYLAFNSYPFELNHNDSKNYDKIYEKITKSFTPNKASVFYSVHFNNFLKKLLEKDIKKRININEALNDYWVKGAEILLNEKEKLGNISNFLSYLLMDHYKSFEDYIKKNGY